VASRIVLAGRIVVQTGDATIDERVLPGRQPRLVFTMLVCERHRPVTRDELSDNLWPDRRPATWETALRGVVSRVRGFVVASGLGPGELLQARAGTYQLRLEGVDVDLDSAVTATRRASSALHADDAVRAARWANEAQAVLTRPLLAGIESPWLEARRRELTLELQRTLETLAQARLRLGQYAQAVTASQAAITADPFREAAHRLLLRAHIAAGEPVAGLQAFEHLRTLLAEELGVDPSAEAQAMHLELLRMTATPASLLAPPRPAVAAGDPSDSSPYPGLRSFDAQDAARFFGRSADVTRLLDRFATSRFLAVLGASGSGKSSLVRAGLVPALGAGALPGSDTWDIRMLRPGTRPLVALVGTLCEAIGPAERAAVARRLARAPWRLHTLVEDVLAAGPGADRLVLVVDQLEEVFTLCSDTRERRAFLEALASAASAPAGRCVVVATLRVDFYPQLAQHPSVSDLASSHQVLVTPMDEVGLASAIEGPARLAGLALEPGLTQAILRDVARRPGALPLLAHALIELWDRRSDGVLTLDGYRASGGVEGAVAQRAEAAYTGLRDVEREVARRVLLRLIQPGSSGGDTRRGVTFDELVTRPEEQPTVARVVETLTAARLLTTGGAPDGEQCVEVSHEALIECWPRLRSWVDQDRRGLVVHRRLTMDAVEWQRLARDEGALYRGAHLAEAAAWAQRSAGSTNRLEREFLQASLAAQQAQRRARTRRLRTAVASLIAGLLVTAGLSTVALVQAQRLAVEVRATTARELAALAVTNLDVDPERSILLALEAVEATREADGTVVRAAEESLHRALKSSRLVRALPQGGFGVGVTSDGARVLTVGANPGDNTATLWDAGTGERLEDFVGPEVGRPAAALSPDDRHVATTHNDGTVLLWSASSGRRLHVLRGHEGFVTYPAFSPDGRRLATGGEDRTVRVWDVDTGVEVATVRGSAGTVLRPTFNPDGTQLALVDDQRVRIWDLAAEEVVGGFSDRPWGVRHAIFSPDGTQIATVGEYGTARLWDAASGELVRTMNSPAGLDAVAFSPNGSRLATVGDDGIARLWAVETGEEVLSLAGHTGGGVQDVVFTSDGRHLLTSGLDDTTRIWDVSVTGARDWLTVPGATGIFTGVAFSPDGARFAAPGDPAGIAVWDATSGRAVRSFGADTVKYTNVAFSPDGESIVAASDLARAPPVWDASTGEQRLALVGHPEAPRAIAFSPDGSRLVTGSVDGTARLWSAESGDQLAVLRPGVAVFAVAFSPDGRLIATGEGDGGTSLWDATTLERVDTFGGHTAAVAGLAFGRDGLLVTASEDGTARVWDLDTGRERLVFTGHRVLLNQVAISPDGTTVATASDDGTTKLWDPYSGEELLTLVGHHQLVYGVAFSPDGRLVATASPDGTVAVHLLDVDELVALARDRVTRQLTEEECRRFLRLDACLVAAGS
jgi:WD40 repeat protein/DNA-binding SARP family transcriptional activator